MVSTELNFNNGRIASIDILRGFAALGVVFFHFTAETSIHLSASNPLRILGIYGHLGVPVFFILSGFVIPFSMFNNGYRLALLPRFLLKRLVRIEIPYLSLIAIEVVLIYISSWTPWTDSISARLQWRTLLLNIGYISGLVNEPWLIPAFWTLAIEFQFYVLIALVFPLLSSKTAFVRIATLMALLAGHLLVPTPNLFLHHAPFFLVGIVLYQFAVKSIGKLECIGWIALIMSVTYMQSNLVSVVAILITILMFCYFRGEWAWAGLLGMISYSIYLIHIPFGGRALLLINRFVSSEPLKCVFIGLCILLTVLIAWIFFLLIERPSLALARKIKFDGFASRG